MPAHVIAVDFSKGVCFTDDGRAMPITALIDEFNERTDDFESAVRFFATSETEAFVGNVADWHQVTVH